MSESSKKISVVNADLYCLPCGKQFSNLQNRNRHMRSTHSDQKLVCDVCGFETKRPDNFARHREKHPIINESHARTKRINGLKKKRKLVEFKAMTSLVDVAEVLRDQEEEEILKKKYASNRPMTLEEEYDEIAAIQRVEKIQEKRRQEEAERLALAELEREKANGAIIDDDDDTTESNDEDY